MTDRSLTVERLLAGGFEAVGDWRPSASGGIALNGAAPAAKGVYAFAVNGVVRYVGVASSSVEKRLYFYAKPGPTQRTNLRLNLLITEVLASGAEIDVFAATPPDFEWNGWTLCGAQGLEAGLISKFHLPWNVRGNVKAVGAEVAPPSIRPSPAVAAHDDASPGIEMGGRRDKYRPLREYLQNCTEQWVSMTFAQIEQLVGPLPKSASLHRAWWGNHEGNSQAKGWMPAKYLAEPNPPQRSVVFRKFSY
jgi:hypothetical protein